MIVISNIIVFYINHYAREMLMKKSPDFSRDRLLTLSALFECSFSLDWLVELTGYKPRSQFLRSWKKASGKVFWRNNPDGSLYSRALR